MTKPIGDLIARITDEQATGIPQHTKNLGKFYISQSMHLAPQFAGVQLRAGLIASIHVPAAGAGSWREVFELLGYQQAQVLQSCSSAGDWTFAVKDGDHWFPAFQTNRHPRHGFEYSVDHKLGFSSVEELCRYYEL
jgi:hypothetical protein